jgi:hypothetical protein
LQKIALEKEKELRKAKEKEAEEKIKSATESQRLLAQQLEKERATKKKLQTRVLAIDSVNRTLEEYRSKEQKRTPQPPKIPVINLDHLIKK